MLSEIILFQKSGRVKFYICCGQEASSFWEHKKGTDLYLLCCHVVRIHFAQNIIFNHGLRTWCWEVAAVPAEPLGCGFLVCFIQVTPVLGFAITVLEVFLGPAFPVIIFRSQAFRGPYVFTYWVEPPTGNGGRKLEAELRIAWGPQMYSYTLLTQSWDELFVNNFLFFLLPLPVCCTCSLVQLLVVSSLPLCCF